MSTASRSRPGSQRTWSRSRVEPPAGRLGRAAVKAFGKVGYVVDRQRSSHIQLRRSATPFRRLTVPDHRELARGLLRALIRDAGLTVDEFVALLR